ncbi:MAG: NADH-quinone oxidoreductase subunit D-related protein [Armatimonadota bacterium]
MRSRGIGVISGADATNWGLSGPVLRGSGVPFDLRTDQPYSVYDRMKFEIALHYEFLHDIIQLYLGIQIRQYTQN